MSKSIEENIAGAAPIIRILKTATCSNLSGKSSLEYHVGYCQDDAEICFRVVSNTGGGYFSPQWVSLKAVQAAIAKAPKPLTSFAMSMLFLGKSVNTPSFLFAALKQEGLVATDPENIRAYVVVSPEAFMSEMTKLIDAGTDIKVPAKVTGKGVVKSNSKEDVPVLAAASEGRPKKAKS